MQTVIWVELLLICEKEYMNQYDYLGSLYLTTILYIRMDII